LKDRIHLIDDQGGEIGLHGSKVAHASLDTMLKEKKEIERVLGREVCGYRNHYLVFRTPLTWRLLQEAGFRYDATFGYADCAGFRNGMCYPFEPFDLERHETVGKILEFPLTIMDGSLFGYMKLDYGTAWEVVRDLTDKVRAVNGVLVILWHNTYFYGENLRFYEKFLSYCQENKAWMTSCAEVHDFWKRNGYDKWMREYLEHIQRGSR